MNKLKQNLFWVGIGAAGLVLVAIFVGFVWFNLWDTRSTLTGAVASLNQQLTSLKGQPAAGAGATSGVPGSPDIDQWKARREEYVKEYREIADHYVKRDKPLEQWFSGLNNPSYDQFTAPYVDNGHKLEKMLRDKGIKVGYPDSPDEKDAETEAANPKYGFNWGDVANYKWADLTEPERAQVVRDLQKRFWICQQITNACLADDVKIIRLNDVYFFKALTDTLKHTEMAIPRPQANEGSPAYVNDPVTALGPLASGANRFDEFVLPDNGEKVDAPDKRKFLGKTISFGVSVTMPYSEVPKFIREVLTPSKSTTPLLVNIIGCRVIVPNQNPFTRDVVIKVDEGDPQMAEKKKIAKDDEEKKVKPVPVQVWLTCQVIDFDHAGVPEWIK